jgi:hypothetical protein
MGHGGAATDPFVKLPASFEKFERSKYEFQAVDKEGYLIADESAISGSVVPPWTK